MRNIVNQCRAFLKIFDMRRFVNVHDSHVNAYMEWICKIYFRFSCKISCLRWKSLQCAKYFLAWIFLELYFYTSLGREIYCVLATRKIWVMGYFNSVWENFGLTLPKCTLCFFILWILEWLLKISAIDFTTEFFLCFYRLRSEYRTNKWAELW